MFSDPSLYFHLLGLLVLSIWVGIAVARDRFWLLERDPTPPSSTDWPPVTAVIPARNEAESLPEALHSLWSQQYPGGLRVIVVDDQSEDGTAEAAREAAGAFPDAPLTVLRGAPVPPGWAGKVWAMHQGLTRGLAADDPARYVLFCDADVRHGPDSLRELVARAEAGGLDLASLMVRLRCRTWPERALIPAFVWFFRMLYPFRRVNSPRDPLAGAAGGAMLLRREALARTSSLERIRDEIIDDCALAAAIKEGGHPIWLGMGSESYSLRGYGTLLEVVEMIARTAYTQLGYSPRALLGCVVGLGITFLAPPALTLWGEGPGRILAGIAWGIMAGLYGPMLRYYGRSLLWAPFLPLVAGVYLAATVLSALRHHRGVGGRWKGRNQSAALHRPQ